MKYISVILPMYNEEANILPMYQKVTKVLHGINRDYEIIFVDDGSKDRTFTYLSELYKRDGHGKVISFRRNYG
ncbi:MAG: glycosyltransferase, partial [Nanoarchaeota archaeon]